MDGQTQTAYDPLSDPAFHAASLQDQYNYLKATDQNFAKASPKDQSDFLNFVHYGPQPQKQGFFGAVGDYLGGMARNIVPTRQMTPGPSAEEQDIAAGQQRQAEAQARQGGGYNSLYRAIAPSAEATGIPVAQMEKAAKAGDTGAVLGYAAVPAAMAVAPMAAEGAVRAMPAVNEAAGRAAGFVNDTAREFGPPASTVDAITEKQARNFSSAVEMGSSAPKNMNMHEDLSVPMLSKVRTEAANQGITPDMLKGPDGPNLMKKVTAGVRQNYNNSYDQIFEPVRDANASGPALQASQNIVNAVQKRVDLYDAINSTGSQVKLQNLADKIGSSETLGDLDDLREELNRINTSIGKDEAGHYRAPVFQGVLEAAGNNIREVLYGEMGKLYEGSNSELSEQAIRQLQQEHGKAIALDQMMDETQRKMSSQASKEASPPGLVQRFLGADSGSSGRAWVPRTLGGGVGAAVGGAIGGPAGAAIGAGVGAAGGEALRILHPPSVIDLFNLKMQRALEGATPKAPPLTMTPPPGRAGALAPNQPELSGLNTPKGWQPVQQGPIILPVPADTSAVTGWNQPHPHLFNRLALPAPSAETEVGLSGGKPVDVVGPGGQPARQTPESPGFRGRIIGPASPEAPPNPHEFVAQKLVPRTGSGGPNAAVPPNAGPAPGNANAPPAAPTPNPQAGGGGGIRPEIQPNKSDTIGAATKVTIPGSETTLAAKYELRDGTGIRQAEVGTPSSMPLSNHLGSPADHTTAPPAVSPEGHVISKGIIYSKAQIEANAAKLGLDPAAAKGMKNPVLVRVIEDHEFEEPPQ